MEFEQTKFDSQSLSNFDNSDVILPKTKPNAIHIPLPYLNQLQQLADQEATALKKIDRVYSDLITQLTNQQSILKSTVSHTYSQKKQRLIQYAFGVGNNNTSENNDNHNTISNLNSNTDSNININCNSNGNCNGSIILGTTSGGNSSRNSVNSVNSVNTATSLSGKGEDKMTMENKNDSKNDIKNNTEKEKNKNKNREGTVAPNINSINQSPSEKTSVVNQCSHDKINSTQICTICTKKKYQCGFCPKSFHSRWETRRHERIHTVCLL